MIHIGLARRAAVLPCTAALLAWGCGGAGEGADRPSVVVVEEAPDVLISTETGLIGAVADMAVGDDGSLFLADEQASAVHVLDPSGRWTHSIGRKGAGPQELSRPSALAVSGDTLLVFDAGNRRVVTLSRQGDALHTSPLPPEAPTYFPALRTDGSFVSATLGLGSALAKVFVPGSEPVPIGTPVGAVGNVVRISALKDEIGEGAIPSLFLNNVEPVWVGDAIWLVSSARGTLERYFPRGERLDSILVEEPEMAVVLDSFHARNRDLPGHEVFPLRYFMDARGVGEELWVLLGSSREGAATLLIATGQGEPLRRIEVPKVFGATGFAVDRVRGRLYFSIAETAQVMRVPVPVSGS